LGPIPNPQSPIPNPQSPIPKNSLFIKIYKEIILNAIIKIFNKLNYIDKILIYILKYIIEDIRI